MVAVMFVCLGNICRSPAGEGMLKDLLAKNNISDEQVHVESSGLGDWHIGHLPDHRMREAALSRGISLISKAKHFEPFYFDVFDYILAADHVIMKNLYQNAKTPEHKAKLHLITAFSKKYKNQEIPDPYYEGIGAFDLVLDILEDSCLGLLEEIKKSIVQHP